MQNRQRITGVRGLIAALLAAVLLCGTALPLAVYATTQGELQSNLNDAKSEYNAASNALKDAEQETADAKAQVNTLNAKSQSILAQITALDTEINELNSQITELEGQIEVKQGEIDARWGDFKSRMAAMQELNDNGAMKMFSAIENLYQFLTFNEVLQDITQKDTEVLDEMQALKTELEEAKALREEAAAELETQKAELETKKAELAASLQEANAALSEAKAAEAAQEVITEELRKEYERAQAELDAYIKSQLDAAGDGGLSCGMNFQAALPYYTYISTYFGAVDAWHSKAHGGTDYAAPYGTPIYACESGTVTIARYSSSYGNYVSINHGRGTDGNTYATLYAHMSSYCVSYGQYVERGQVIGYVGSTGRSTGNHLHLELWRNSVRINSRSMIPDL